MSRGQSMGSHWTLPQWGLAYAAVSAVAVCGLLLVASIFARLYSGTIDWNQCRLIGGILLPIVWIVFPIVVLYIKRKKPRSSQVTRPRVFISHSTADKEFVRRLIEDLKSKDLKIWFDERAIQPGASIVAGVSDGLKDTDYLVVVLSQASVNSKWVQAELNAGLMRQLSEGGTTVLPVLIEDCDIPVLLKDRLYADFRTSYPTGLRSLLSVFEQESNSGAALSGIPVRGAAGSGAAVAEGARGGDDCPARLSRLTLGDLRRRIATRLARDEISALWFGTFERKMDDDMSGRFLNECVIELLDRARRQDKLSTLFHEICSDHPALAQP